MKIMRVHVAEKIFPIEYIKNSDKVPLCDVCKSTVIHPGVYLHGEMLV